MQTVSGGLAVTFLQVKKIMSPSYFTGVPVRNEAYEHHLVPGPSIRLPSLKLVSAHNWRSNESIFLKVGRYIGLGERIFGIAYEHDLVPCSSMRQPSSSLPITPEGI